MKNKGKPIITYSSPTIEDINLPIKRLWRQLEKCTNTKSGSIPPAPSIAFYTWTLKNNYFEKKKTPSYYLFPLNHLRHQSLEPVFFINNWRIAPMPNLEASFLSHRFLYIWTLKNRYLKNKKKSCHYSILLNHRRLQNLPLQLLFFYAPNFFYETPGEMHQYQIRKHSFYPINCVTNHAQKWHLEAKWNIGIYYLMKNPTPMLLITILILQLVIYTGYPRWE